ncbi:hypothetical protein G6F62_014835 [Rhizopus arrhizus]|nr:hypothetical protein G6F23_015801 [Rhizopus arrhizus]KAG1309337.1 hypothetical protein G6F62_014835 [Rhizopus arrhizus]
MSRGTGRRVPADGGHADRDQVAHAAAGQEDRHRRRARRSARRTGPPPARIRTDEAGRPEAGQAAATGPRLRQQPGRGRPQRRTHDARSQRG